MFRNIGKIVLKDKITGKIYTYTHSDFIDFTDRFEIVSLEERLF